MGTGWELTKALREQIVKYAGYQQTSISLRQMVQFGPTPSPGSVFLASQFIVEELPIRLAIKVKNLENSPHGLNKMPSTMKVRDWYAQSFQELTELPKPQISSELAEMLNSHQADTELHQVNEATTMSPILQEDMKSVEETHNPANSESKNVAINNIFSDDGIVVRTSSAHSHMLSPEQTKNSKGRSESPTFGKTYYTSCPANVVWPKEVYDYNKLVSDALSKIKKRHDATVATMAQGVQEWKNEHKTVIVNSQIQTFLDRFYMSRIGIRMLIDSILH